MRRTLTDSQKMKLIRFAEEHADFLDNLLSLDRVELEQIADDQETIDKIDAGYYGNDTRLNRSLYSDAIRQHAHALHLRRALKQLVEA
jgi:hypothetical protein